MAWGCIKQHFCKMKCGQPFNAMHDWLHFLRKTPLASFTEHSARGQLF